MHPHRLDQNRPSSLVVAGMVDVLQVEGVVDPAPRVQVVVALDDVFAGVAELAVSKQESEAAEREVGLVIALDGVGDEGYAELVVRARPALPE